MSFSRDTVIERTPLNLGGLMAAGNYAVNRIPQSTGDHEVHLSTCRYFPSHRIDLGYHFGCASAVAAARQFFPQSNGCYWCAPQCNTG